MMKGALGALFVAVMLGCGGAEEGVEGAATSEAGDAGADAATPSVSCVLPDGGNLSCDEGFVCFPPASNQPILCGPGNCAPAWPCSPIQAVYFDAGPGICEP